MSGTGGADGDAAEVGTVRAEGGGGEGAGTGEAHILRAGEWLRSIQNADGGWGESCLSYDNRLFTAGPSTPSQTAWAILGLIAGAPAIPGAWLGGFVTSDVLGVLFFAGAAGAALEVVVEVGRYVARKAPGGVSSSHVLGGYLAGIAVMYVTGLLV